MTEYEITVFRKGEDFVGICTLGKPASARLLVAPCCFSFVRGAVRIWVISHETTVSENLARHFAVALYEGKCLNLNFNDYHFADRFAAICGSGSTS